MATTSSRRTSSPATILWEASVAERNPPDAEHRSAENCDDGHGGQDQSRRILLLLRNRLTEAELAACLHDTSIPCGGAPEAPTVARLASAELHRRDQATHALLTRVAIELDDMAAG